MFHLQSALESGFAARYTEVGLYWTHVCVLKRMERIPYLAMLSPFNKLLMCI